jgi:hypothetical protein
MRLFLLSSFFLLPFFLIFSFLLFSFSQLFSLFKEGETGPYIHTGKSSIVLISKIFKYSCVHLSPLRAQSNFVRLGQERDVGNLRDHRMMMLREGVS